MTVDEVRAFVASQSLVARLVSVLLREVGDTPADKCISFLVGGGLETDPRAIAITEREYTNYVLNHPWPTPETAVQAWVDFYCQLSKAFEKAGI